MSYSQEKVEMIQGCEFFASAVKIIEGVIKDTKRACIDSIYMSGAFLSTLDYVRLKEAIEKVEIQT